MKTEREKITDFALTLPGAVADMPFEDDFDTTVFRHGEGGKWFGLVMNVEKSRVGLRGEGKIDVLNLKCDPEESFIVREMYEGIIPAYHMNKEHWSTVIIGKDATEENITDMLYTSYLLTQKKPRKSK